MNYSIAELNEHYIQKILHCFKDKKEVHYVFPTASYPISGEQIRAITDSRKNNTVLLLEDNFVGFANLYSIVPGESCFIGNIIIDPYYREKHAAVFLMQHMIEIAKEKYNIKELNAMCWAENTPGILFYHKNDFSPREIKLHISEGNEIPVLHMQKQL